MLHAIATPSAHALPISGSVIVRAQQAVVAVNVVFFGLLVLVLLGLLVS